MTTRTTDRKSKGKSTRPDQDLLDTFELPEGFSCSELHIPRLLKKNKLVKWNDILRDQEEWMQEIKEYEESKAEPAFQSPFKYTESEYLRNEVFVFLIPVLEQTLVKAKIWNALYTQKCFFNGIDFIVQELWNNNPRRPERKVLNQHLFNMYWVKEYLKIHPREFYPKSWLWPEDYAATMIQKTVRQYFVQKQDDVQEMRDFWRKVKLEKEHPQIEINPLLAKRFAAFSNNNPHDEDGK